MDAASENTPRSYRLGLILSLILIVGIVIARSTAEYVDFAIANIITLILGFSLLVTLMVMVVRLPMLGVAGKIGVLLTPPLLLILFLIFYQPVAVDSELVPQFRYRWGAAQAKLPVMETMEQVKIESLSADTDFPQFLGVNRNGIVSGIALASDWKSTPPKVLWKQPIGAGWAAFSVVGELAVTLEQRDEEEWISAYQVTTGKLVWKYAWKATHFNPLGGRGPRSTPTIADGRVFAHGASGKLIAVSLADGKLLWEADLLALAGIDQATAEKEVAWGRSGSPLIVDDMVVVPLGGTRSKSVVSLIAFEAATGTERWRGGDDQISYASPMIVTLSDVKQILSVNEKTMSSHDPSNGAELWSVEWDGASNGSATVSQPVLFDTNKILLSKAYGTGSKAIEVTRDASGKWSIKKYWDKAANLKTKFTNVVLHQGFAFALSDGILECVSLTDGERKWKGGRYRHGQILLVGDLIVVSAEDGSVALVKASPDKFLELARMPVISGVTWNNPALSGNRLLVRNGEEAACLELPLESSKDNVEAL